MAQKPYSFPLSGGLDLVTPPLSIKPGRLIFAENYEPVSTGGYRRILGYERFDGRLKPSLATYSYVYFDAGSTEPTAGQQIDGAISGASGIVLSVTVDTGAWGTNDAAGYIVIYNEIGLFQDNENIQISAVTVAVADGESEQDPELDEAIRETHYRAAREARRSVIVTVPGSGPIRGICGLNGNVYAFRDNIAQTQCAIYRATATGWVNVATGFNISFTAGTTKFLIGETVTGGTSGAFGIIVGVAVDSGSWGNNDAAGKLYIMTITGSFQAETITSASGSATCTGAQVATTLLPGGKFEFITYNFYGQAGSKEIYGCDGVNRGFSFNGTDFAFIHTGLATDTPKFIAAHKKHLFFAIGSSIQHSSIGDPHEFSAVTGASEIATGDDVVGFGSEPGDVMSIFNRNAIYLLYGSDSSSWDLKTHSDEKGASEYTLQRMDNTVYMDSRGLSKLSTVQEFGDFKAGLISQQIDPLFKVKKGLVKSSVRISSKDQYRLFFSDNTFLIAMFDSNGVPSYTPGIFDHVVETTASLESATGEEEIYFGSDDGFVYQMEAGESFDGQLMSYYLRLPFANMGIPRHKKRVFKAIVDVDALLPPTISFSPEFSYGGPDQPALTQQQLGATEIFTGGGYWGELTWGDFIWDAQIMGQAEAYIDGSGINISLTIGGESNYEPPHTLLGVTYHYAPRGMKR